MTEVYEESIVVLAKTYPEISRKYGCLVCVAGINELGEWRRLYPIPWYLFFKGMLRFRKWDEITLRIEKAKHDPRRESFRVLDPNQIVVTGSIDDWGERRKFLDKFLDGSIEELREQKRSLGLIKPRKIIDFTTKPRHRLSEGEKKTLDRQIQTLLPELTPPIPKWSKLRPKKLPWLGYEFKCFGRRCRGHKMMCIDWEIQELYRKLLEKYGNEEKALSKTREKALEWMKKRDMYFVVGTTWRFPTWMIIGIHYPPKIRLESVQADLIQDRIA